jgi:hypothetical protein
VSSLVARAPHDWVQLTKAAFVAKSGTRTLSHNSLRVTQTSYAWSGMAIIRIASSTAEANASMGTR